MSSLLLLLTLLLCGVIFIDTTDLIFKEHAGNKQRISNAFLPRNALPLHYNIDLVPDVSVYDGHVIIHGKSAILISVTHTTSVICLHFVGVLTEVTMTSKGGTVFELDKFYNEGDTLHISFKDLLIRGNYNLVMRYISFPPSERGIFQTSRFVTQEDEEKWYITTTFQPIGARYTFPCWDEPAIKATFRVSVRHHQNYMVFASSALENETMENNMIWKHFKETPCMSTYRLGIMIAPLDDLKCRSVLNGHINLWHRKHLNLQTAYVRAIIRMVNDAMGKYLKFFMETPEMEHVAISRTEHESIENKGLVVYREDALLYDRELDPIMHKMYLTRLIIRTVAHQWFGNVVSPSWWSHLWLNEGFAYFIEKNIYTEINSLWRLNELFIVQTQHESLHLDIDYNMIPLEGKKNSSETLLSPYSLCVKAPVILCMLEHVITSEVFQNSIIKYLSNYKYKNAKPEDLWNVMMTVLNERNADYSYYKLENMMNAWIKQSNYPVVNVKRNYDTGEITIWQQLNEQEVNRTQEEWWIPVTFTTQSDLDFSSTAPQMWLKPNDVYVQLCANELEFQCPVYNSDWIILNLQWAGYYRVYYDHENWRLIANYLNSNYTNIHVLNRAQIIDDAYHFMTNHFMANQLDYDMFVRLTSYLSRETDYIAWYPMLKNFEYLSSFLPFEESFRLKAHMLEILNGLVVKLGYNNRRSDSDLTNSLRQEAAKWICMLDEPLCKKVANVKLQVYLEDPENHIILPGWKEWTYCHGLNLADLVTWSKVRNHLNTKTSHEKAFEFLSCIEKSATVDTVLKYILSENNIKSNRRINLFYAAIAKYARNNLDIILENFEEYSMTKHNEVKTLSIIINHVYSTKHLQEIQRYVYKNIQEKQIPDVASALKTRWNQITRHAMRISKLFHVKLKEPIELKQEKISSTELDKSFYSLDNVVPLHYDIKVKVVEHEEELITENEYSVKFVTRRETREIRLHAPRNKTAMDIHMGLLINHDALNPLSNSITIKSSYLEKTYYTLKECFLTLHFENALLPGNYTLMLKFSNTLRNGDNIMYKTSYVNENGIRVWIGTTRFHPIGAREMFPCWDEPAFKSTFNISIKYKRLYTALSNTLGLTQYLYKDSDFIMSNFQSTPPISTYSLAMVITPNFDHIYYKKYDKKYEGDYIWCRPHLIQYVKYVPELADSLGKYFATITSIEIPKMDHIVMRGIDEEIIGSIGLIIYNEASVIFDKELNFIGHKMRITRTIARSVARQWFGDVISPLRWSYLWLTDGLAAYFADQAIHKVVSLWRMNELFVVQVQHESLHLDVDYNVKPLATKNKNPLEIKTLNSYSLRVKAPAIIRMLRYISSNDTQRFLEIIKIYFEKHQFQAVTPDDLWTIIETENSKNSENYINNIRNRPALKDVMNMWTTQMHYPVLKVTRNYNNGTVTVSHENLNTLDSNQWWIPITYTTQTEMNFTDTLPALWKEPNNQSLSLEKIVQRNEWIIVNLQQGGYYRVNYDPTNWQLIANYLNSGNYSKIHVLNRAQIIDDAYHFMMANQFDYHLFLHLTNYLSMETDYVAWYPMLKIIEYLSSFFPYERSAPLKDHTLKILNGLLEKIGYEEHPDDNSLTMCLRQTAARWACFLGDSHCKRTANVKLTAYLKNPVQQILPGWREWTFCNGLDVASRITWLKFWSIYAKSSDDKALNLTPCSGDLVMPNFHLSAKHMEISSKLIVPKNARNECTNFLYSVITRNRANDLTDTLDNLEEYIFYCAISLRDVTKLLIIIINRVYFEHELLKMKKFVQDSLKEEKVVTDIRYVINTRWYQIKHQTNKLSQLLARRFSVKNSFN